MSDEYRPDFYIVCDHSHRDGYIGPERIMAYMRRLPRERPDGGGHWGELVTDGGEDTSSTYAENLAEYAAETNQTDIDAAVAGMHSGDTAPAPAKWRFYCPDCKDTLPLRSGTLEAILDVYMRNGDNWAALRDLRAEQQRQSRARKRDEQRRLAEQLMRDKQSREQ